MADLAFGGHCKKECCHPEIKELNRQIKMLKAKQDAIYELCVHTNDPDKDLTLSDMIINKILE